jgi:Tol biopolymer transport system component
MKRLLAGSVLLVAFVTGSAAARARPAKAFRSVLVYAKATSATSSLDTEHVWRARIDGRDPKRLGVGSDPAVSPDGRWIAFGRGRKVLVVPTVGGTLKTVYTLHKGQPTLAGAPVWAPDSRMFGVLDSAGLAVVDPSRRTAKVLPPADGFAFSPNSRRIAYTARGDLYVISAGGGKPRRLTDDSKSFAPVWGKTGIAFVRFTRGTHGDVWLSDARPRHARRLTRTGAAFWPAFFSADGTKLLAANPATHNGRLWAVEVSTGKARPLTPWTGDLVPQGLSRSGKTVLAAVGCGGVPGLLGYVETIPFAGGKPHVIVRGPCRASWNAR